MTPKLIRLLPWLGAATACAGLLTACGGSDDGPPAQIKVLSNRADLVSGGDVLIEIVPPPNMTEASIRVAVNSTDATAQFARRSNGRYMGLVTGLTDRKNVVDVFSDGFRSAQVSITNWPSGGPIFSGPQLSPWKCQPGALDAQCNRPTTYSYRYKSSATGQFAAYDPANPPSDVATTKTDAGQTVPYIVRLEVGNQNRDQYKIAALWDPTKDSSAWNPQPSWNRKLVIVHGIGCGGKYGEADYLSPFASGGAIADVMHDQALGLGFVVATTALANSSHNCNVVVQAESLMMLKEHIVEAYGEIRYTIALGGSGGALAQYQVANAYPGIYQGLVPSAVYTDAWTAAIDVEDCPLMQAYFDSPAKWAAGVAWNAAQQLAATGKTGPTVCPILANVQNIWANFVPSVVPPNSSPFGLLDFQNCGLSAAEAWDAATNPAGPRCTLQDRAVNLFGKRAADGYANRPYDNVGVQYGLKALMAGVITPAQFVDLNAKIGAHDINYQWQGGRVAADTLALTGGYRSGAINGANNLGLVAIIERPGGNYDGHEEFRSFAMRARLDRELGGHGNQVIWNTTAGVYPDPFLAMDRWLAAVEADTSSASLAQKIVSHRPSDVRDICEKTDANGVCQSIGGATSTRGGAGGPIVSDILKCQLKPLVAADYAPVTFTADQWTALQQVFPEGVCDWSKPGVEQQKTIPWQTYQADGGTVVYGGKAMPPLPGDSRGGWNSPAFIYR